MSESKADKALREAENPANQKESGPDRHGRYSVVKDAGFHAPFGYQPQADRSRFRFL